MAKGGVDGPSAVVGIKSNLEPRPLCEELETALQAISDIDKKLLGQFGELTQGSCPSEVDVSHFRSSQRLKEDLMKIDAEMEKRKQLAVVKVAGEHRHVEDLKHEADTVPVTSTASVDPARKPPARPKTLQSVAIPIPAPKLGPQSGLREVKAEPSTWDAGATTTTSSPVDIGKKMARSTHSFASTIATLSPISVGQKLTTIDEDGGFRVSDFPKELIYMVEDIFAEGKEEMDISQMFGHKLMKVPETISDCVSLTLLNLAEQQIETLPDSIGCLINLVTLDLHSNKLTELPETIGFLEKLVTLNLHANKLEELPVTIGNCTKLEKLHADFNQLKNLPESIGQLTKLRVFVVHLNRLKRLPVTIGNLVNLEELDAHFNHLEHIPDTLCNLTNLKKLDLCSNFTELKGIPSDFGRLTALADLNISYNSLRALPQSFGDLKNLKKFKADGNPMVDPPQAVLDEGIEAVLTYFDKKKEQAELKANKKKNPFTRFWTTVVGTPKEEEFGRSLKELPYY